MQHPQSLTVTPNACQPPRKAGHRPGPELGSEPYGPHAGQAAPFSGPWVLGDNEDSNGRAPVLMVVAKNQTIQTLQV